MDTTTIRGDEVRYFTPHQYQLTTRDFILARTILSGQPEGGAAVLLEPGMGKTSAVLSAFDAMQKIAGVRRALIVAPLRVCYKVWPSEIKQWCNFRHMTYTIVHGTREERSKRLTLPVDVHIINQEGVDWLAKVAAGRKGRLPWDLLIVDESTGFKNWSARRSKAIRELSKRIPYRIIMTGTPAPRNLEDLFGQIWILDHGRALGDNISRFRERYCAKEGHGKSSKFKIRDEMAPMIKAAVAPMCLRLDIRDYLSMPPITHHNVLVDLPDDAREKYDRLEEAMLIALETEDKVIGQAAALYGACKQVANGGLYDSAGRPHNVHHALDDATEEIVNELQGKPCLIAYHYKHDLLRLQARFPKIKAIQGGMPMKEFEKLVDQWNSDKLERPYLAVQPQALSHGINMQHGSGRDIIWYGPTDNLDHYLQFNARIWRQGVTSGVRIHRLLATGTVHSMIWGRTDEKQSVQNDLLSHLREYGRQKKRRG